MKIAPGYTVLYDRQEPEVKRSMNQSATIQRLTKHLERIELEISDIRRELKALPNRQKQETVADTEIIYAFVNKAAMREQIRQLLITLSIKNLPVGAETVQNRMREADLTANELSQSIIAAREE